MSCNFKSNCQYFICYCSEKTPGTSFAFNLRTSTRKTPNFRARVYKAIVRVSNVIKSVILKQGHRLFIGFQTTCKVYDSIYVLRCYKCQGFITAKTGADDHETCRCTEKGNV